MTKGKGSAFLGGLLVGAGAAYSLRQAQARGGAAETPSSRLAQYGSRVGDIAGLEGASLEVPRSRAPRRSPWRRRGFRLAGGMLVLYSLLRRGRTRRIARALGMGLLARAATQRASSSDRRQIVDIQKTLYVEAPVDHVYAFWSNYENFPLFMSNVREVEDLGSGRSRWTVRGPGRASIRWYARLTDQVPNAMLAWRSEPGAMLDNAGIIRFQPEGQGTRLDLRLCYRPPAGPAGRALATLFSTDPRAKLNEDLGRLKALLEATVRSKP